MATSFPLMDEHVVLCIVSTVGACFGFLFVFAYFIWLFVPPTKFEEVPQHVCRKCGYDLRATPDRCPECGTVVKR